MTDYDFNISANLISCETKLIEIGQETAELKQKSRLRGITFKYEPEMSQLSFSIKIETYLT